MIPIVDTAGMREADRVTISELGLPGIVLMELAAAAVTDLVAERFAEADRVLVVCGPGNNGGDGLAVARHLHNRGCALSIQLSVDPQHYEGDALTNYRIVREMRLPMQPASLVRYVGPDAPPPPALVVDAIRRG